MAQPGLRRRTQALAGAGVLIAGLAMAVGLPGIGLSQETPGGTGHPRIPNAASLSGERAEAVYQSIRRTIRQNYAASDEPLALAYQSWQRFNRLPYRSPNHGARFVNHYGNDLAADYAKYENLKPLPPGAIVIKDSFLVTRQGVVQTGPLFVMEKMEPGFVSAAGTWRFWMLRSDGSLLGMTGGPDAAKVQFCAECHKSAGPGQDYLYFMPVDARLTR